MLSFKSYAVKLTEEQQTKHIDLVHPDHGNTSFKLKLTGGNIHYMHAAGREEPTRVFYNMNPDEVMKEVEKGGFRSHGTKTNPQEKSFGGFSWHSENEL